VVNAARRRQHRAGQRQQQSDRPKKISPSHLSFECAGAEKDAEGSGTHSESMALRF
jgi:hypothetical protein